MYNNKNYNCLGCGVVNGDYLIEKKSDTKYLFFSRDEKDRIVAKLTLRNWDYYNYCNDGYTLVLTTKAKHLCETLLAKYPPNYRREADGTMDLHNLLSTDDCFRQCTKLNIFRYNIKLGIDNYVITGNNTYGKKTMKYETFRTKGSVDMSGVDAKLEAIDKKIKELETAMLYAHGGSEYAKAKDEFEFLKKIE